MENNIIDVHVTHQDKNMYCFLKYQPFICRGQGSTPRQQLTSAERKQIPVTVQMTPTHVPGAYWSSASAATGQATSVQPPIARPIRSVQATPTAVETVTPVPPQFAGAPVLQQSIGIQP